MRKCILVLAILALFVVGCSSPPKSTQDAEAQRQRSVQTRAEVFGQAEAVVPVYKPQNFPLRNSLVEFTKRQDMTNHPWYIYVLGDNGNTFGYFVGKTYPQSTCNFLGSTEQITWADYAKSDSHGPVPIKTQAPSLDGVYYGSGATAGGCDYFFFNAATNAMQVIHHDIKWFVSDAPLALNVQPIKVQGE